MNILETEWWTLVLPPEWWAESDQESILIGDQDGVGCIEISTLHKERGEFDEATVAEILRTESKHAEAWPRKSVGEYSGWYSEGCEEGAAMREWYVTAGSKLLYITYSCEEENRGMDDAAVDEILDTLLINHGD